MDNKKIGLAVSPLVSDPLLIGEIRGVAQVTVSSVGDLPSEGR